jgi:hypothetical protein
VFFNERLDEVIAVVVTRVHAQLDKVALSGDRHRRPDRRELRG